MKYRLHFIDNNEAYLKALMILITDILHCISEYYESCIFYLVIDFRINIFRYVNIKSKRVHL
mgnify:CR=1 FL=1